MKNKIYQKIVIDISKEKDEYQQKNLILIKEKIDTLLMLEDVDITNEDILIVLSNFEEDLKSRIEKVYDEELINKMNNLISYIDDFFKTNDYNGDLVLKRKLSNGLYYDEIAQEILLYNKAISLKNSLAYNIKILAIIIIIFSILFSIAMFNEYSNNWLQLLVYGLIFSLILFSISEIIQILHDIRRKLYKKN